MASAGKKVVERAAVRAAGVIAKAAERTFGKDAVEVAAADVAATVRNRVAKTVARDSRRRAIPPGVARLPSGRLPANFEWAGRVYSGERWTAELAEKYPNGVRFSERSYSRIERCAGDDDVERSRLPPGDEAKNERDR